MDHIVIVGAGQAGATVATRLRALGYDGPITMIGDEPLLPYERPPLSKAYLVGRIGRGRLFLRPAAFYTEQRIDLITGRPVEEIDLAARVVRTGRGNVPFDQLVLTTGSRPLRLPARMGGDLPGIHALRTLEDVNRIAPECRAGRRALIVGGGYIGLEAAAVLTALGMNVSLVEQAPRILQRVAAAQTSDYFRALHRSHGVDIREGTALVRIEGETRAARAALSTGEELDVDLVIVGIGVRANDDLARAAGLSVNRGILVDNRGQTSDPRVWAAGDCTVFPWRGNMTRLESVQNAIDQSGVVAAAMLGRSDIYDPVPWFWSDQYDVKLQIAGLNAGHDHVVSRPGNREGSVSHWYFRDEELLAVDAMNDPRSFMCGKQLLGAGCSPDPARIADPKHDLKALIAA